MLLKKTNRRGWRTTTLTAVVLGATLTMASPAKAQTIQYDIAESPLAAALNRYG